MVEPIGDSGSTDHDVSITEVHAHGTGRVIAWFLKCSCGRTGQHPKREVLEQLRDRHLEGKV